MLETHCILQESHQANALCWSGPFMLLTSSFGSTLPFNCSSRPFSVVSLSLLATGPRCIAQQSISGSCWPFPCSHILPGAGGIMPGIPPDIPVLGPNRIWKPTRRSLRLLINALKNRHRNGVEFAILCSCGGPLLRSLIDRGPCMRSPVSAVVAAAAPAVAFPSQTQLAAPGS